MASLFMNTGFVCATLLAATATSAAAETEPVSDVITVYGTTNPLPAFDFPGQVFVVDREEIRQRNASSIGELLRDVPGVQFSGGPRRTGQLPALRGLGGENVLILVDGARQSFISAHDGRFFLDPELIQTAEVVQGPASSLYGSGAVGGVLAFDTLDPRAALADGETYGGTLRLGYQSVNDETLASFTGYTVQGAFDVLGNIATRRSGDISLGNGAELPSDDEITTGLLKAGFNVNDALRLEGSWHHFTNNAIEPNNGQGLSGGSSDTLSRDVDKEVSTDTYRAGVEFDPETPFINANLTVYQSTTSIEELDPSLPRTTLRKIETTGVSARNASTFTFGENELIFTVGGDWYKDEQIGRDSEGTNQIRDGVPNGESEFIGAFAQLEAAFVRPLGLPGELLVIPGVRFDSFESSAAEFDGENDDEATSPRFAASYGPVPWLRVFGSYSKGFRAPSINELYLDGVHFPFPHPVLFDPTGFPPSFVFVNNNFVPNTALTPEETETFEYGLGVDFEDLWRTGDRLWAKVSAFDSDIEDAIDISVIREFEPTCSLPPFFPCTAGTTESNNIDEASIDGIEAQLSYESDLWFARASYSSIDGEDKSDGSDLGTLTPDRLSIDAGLFVDQWDALFGTRIQLADDFERIGIITRTETVAPGVTIDVEELGVVEERDSYAVVDLYARWVPDFGNGLRVDLGVDNVFDEDYERVFQGVPQPGRNVKLSVSYQFAN
ncbi:MAG: TonB-dependent receptor [Pseudomonadota bacterium]